MDRALNYEEIIMLIIAHSGTARTHSMEAIKSAKKRDFTKSKEFIEKANQEFLEAHKIQTKLIEEEINGSPHKVSLLMVHAQDHLMNAMTVKELAQEFISLYQDLK